MACRILDEAEADLRTAVKALALAQPEQLDTAQRLLGSLVATLGAIEAAARREPSLPIANEVRKFQEQLGQAQALNGLALRSIDRQIGMSGIATSVDGPTMHFEG